MLNSTVISVCTACRKQHIRSDVVISAPRLSNAPVLQDVVFCFVEIGGLYGLEDRKRLLVLRVYLYCTQMCNDHLYKNAPAYAALGCSSTLKSATAAAHANIQVPRKLLSSVCLVNYTK